MLDFVRVRTKNAKNNVVEVYPEFLVIKSKDLMVRGKDFYAIWDEDAGLWSTNEDTVCRLVDNELLKVAKVEQEKGSNVSALLLSNFSTRKWSEWQVYVKSLPDNFHELDTRIIFSNTPFKKNDYISKHLDYPLEEGPIESYNELMSTIYDPEERQKLEWAVGAIISGDSKYIQKFIVITGDPGSGKSTILNIIQEMFDGYCQAFSAKALASAQNVFALEAFRSNPLIAIEHDGDLSKIEDNTKLNSIASHETMIVNEKFKSSYQSRFNSFLFMGSNRPVKISEAKAGILRRLIDVCPSGRLLPYKRYNDLMQRIKFELGAIAFHCLSVYKEMGMDYYDSYRPIKMMSATNDFYNYVEDSYDMFKALDEIPLKQAWAKYKDFCQEANVMYPLSMRLFKEELKSYFNEYKDRYNGAYSYYIGFKTDKFESSEGYKKSSEEIPDWLTFTEQESEFDKLYSDCLAQYANDDGNPMYKWAKCKTTLKDIDTHELHWAKPPETLVVIDFDEKDDDGNKSLAKNIEAASKWKKTYAELSKSGEGIHLHYIYKGDPSELSRIFDEHIEVKTFTGNSSLRRKLTKCNSYPIAEISSGLPLKGGKPIINFEAAQTEKGIRTTIKRCLNKEIHGATKPEIDWIYEILERAYNSDLKYDVSDLRQEILLFAMHSSHNADYCLDKVGDMKFKSKEVSEPTDGYDNRPIVFFDVEVFPNLFIIVWKYAGEAAPVKMINPGPEEIEPLLTMKLVGFNNRGYDNHILYARWIGKSLEELYDISQGIINNDHGCKFSEAYNLSYTDIYDFCPKKQSLKKWEIELGIHHQELGLPWDQKVPEKLWPVVADYCINDVVATEAVFNANQAAFKGRMILCDLANLMMGPGSVVNDTTNTLTTKLIVGNNKNAQSEFVYPDLSKEFPGYEFDQRGIDKSRYISEDVIISGKSIYRGYDPGEGGFVYAVPGMYTDVETDDSASHHPSSIIAENGFGPYTKNFKFLLDLRLHVKHKDYDYIRGLLDGALAKYLETDEDADALSFALKIAINSVYGLTAARFKHPLRDSRNIDNWVAKRGALFMIDLMLNVKEMGYEVVHCKTDSIKVAHPDDKVRNYIYEFGKKYGYTFEVEHTFDKFCLVNGAVYIAKCKDEPCNGKLAGKWNATGKQFQIPYVFKTLFSHEDITFDDLCETKSTTTALYLDMNEGLSEGEHQYQFIGRVGRFCPIKEGCGGGILYREKDGKYYAAESTTGYRWLESEVVKGLHKEADIDDGYFKNLVDKAVEAISYYGDFEWFTADGPVLSNS